MVKTLIIPRTNDETIDWGPIFVGWIGLSVVGAWNLTDRSNPVVATIFTVFVIAYLMLIQWERSNRDAVATLGFLAIGWGLVCALTVLIRWPTLPNPWVLYVYSWAVGANAMFLGPLAVIALRIILEHVVAPIGGLLIAGVVIVFDAVMALFSLRRRAK